MTEDGLRKEIHAGEEEKQEARCEKGRPVKGETREEEEEEEREGRESL
jgi:hypothetical protein